MERLTNIAISTGTDPISIAMRIPARVCGFEGLVFGFESRGPPIGRELYFIPVALGGIFKDFLNVPDIIERIERIKAE